MWLMFILPLVAAPVRLGHCVSCPQAGLMCVQEMVIRFRINNGSRRASYITLILHPRALHDPEYVSAHCQRRATAVWQPESLGATSEAVTAQPQQCRQLQALRPEGQHYNH